MGEEARRLCGGGKRGRNEEVHCRSGEEVTDIGSDDNTPALPL